MNDGIETQIYYPTPLPLQPIYKDFGYKVGDFPNADYLSGSCLALPLYPKMPAEHIEFVVKRVRAFYE